MGESVVPSSLAVVEPKEGSEDFVKMDPLKIRVLDCRVLCKVIDYGNISSGGIVLPMGTDNKRALTLMKVIKVGDGRTTDHGVHIDVRVEPGDYVVVGKYAGLEVGASTKKAEYKIINEVEILGVQEVE